MRNRDDWDEPDGLEVPGQVHRTYRSSRRKKKPRLNPRLLIALVCVVVGAVALVALTALSISYIAVNGYNPFIYFNF